MSFNMFDTRTMMGIIEGADKRPKTFLKDRFFSNVRTFNTQKIDFDVLTTGNRRIAPFVNPKIGGVAVDREGFSTNSYEAPEVAPMMVTTSEDMLKRSAGETIYSGKSPTERASQQLGEDLRKLDEIITRREEAMCAEALFTGKVTVKGEGYDEVINYWGNNAKDHPKTVLGTKWTAASVDGKAIMKDLRTIRRAMIQKGAPTPNQLIVGNAVVECMIDKLSKQDCLDSRRVDLGHIDIQHLPNGVTYWGYLKDSALDIYSYDEWYQEEAEGEEKPMVPDNLILMASPNVKTTMAYGLVALTGDDAVKFYEGVRVPDSWVQRQNPSGRIVQIKSRPLPIINQINGFNIIEAV